MQRASALLKISQPALTSHLKSFEQYFPQAIFVFEGRRKVLTPFGEKVRQLFKSRFDYLADDLKVEFIPVNTENVLQGLRDRKFDIGISYDLSQVGDLHAKKFFVYDYSIVIPGRWKIKANKLSQDLMEKLAELRFLPNGICYRN